MSFENRLAGPGSLCQMSLDTSGVFSVFRGELETATVERAGGLLAGSSLILAILQVHRQCDLLEQCAYTQVNERAQIRGCGFRKRASLRTSHPSFGGGELHTRLLNILIIFL